LAASTGAIMIKTLTRTVSLFAAIVALSALVGAGPAFAYTQNGTIPSGRVQIHLQQPIPKNGYVKLTLTIPQVSSVGIHYAVGFCVGSTFNCLQIAQDIPGGQKITVIYASSTLSTNEIWVAQGTSAPVPYTLEVDYLP
jgi:hypothetical protein